MKNWIIGIIITAGVGALVAVGIKKRKAIQEAISKKMAERLAAKLPKEGSVEFEALKRKLQEAVEQGS